MNIKKIIKYLKGNGFFDTVKRIFEKISGLSSGVRYLRKNTPSKIRLHTEVSTIFKYSPKISIIVPLYNTPKNFLCEMIDSVLNQTYSNWELCLADASDNGHAYVEDLCLGYVSVTKQVKYLKLGQNYGISGNSNKCLEMASGEYIALLDHDDVLHPSALHDVVEQINKQKADFIYTDECSFSQSIKIPLSINFKSDFAPDTLRSNNYICHFTVFKRRLLRYAGGFNSECDGSQDYDLILRLTEQARKIVHIPRVLYFWRVHKNSVASGIEAKPYCINAAKKALYAQLNRLGLYGEVLDSTITTTYKIQYMIKGNPLVSIIVPSRDNVDSLNRCLKSIYKSSTYKNFEIIVVENNSEKKSTTNYYNELENIPNLIVINKYGNFNHSLAMKFAVENTKGEYLLFLDDDTEVITPNWIEEMLMFAQRSDVGAVGAKLYYSNNTVEHAGFILGINGIAGNAFRGYSRKNAGYFGRLTYVQNLSAVSGSCMMINKSAYMEVGGFDDRLSHNYNDIDLCLKLRDLGYLNVFTPYAQLYHHSNAKKDYNKNLDLEKSSEIIKRRWASQLERDPYYNLNLTKEKTDFSI